jgi:hypothetical protein
MKKIIPIIVIGLLIILLAGFLVIKNQKKTSTPESSVPDVEVAQAPINQRPFVSLIPRADAHQLTLKVDNLKNIKTVEYELVYSVDDAQRGVIGSVQTNGEASISKDMLLGSCSKNVCKYDEGVAGGTLTLRFRGSGSVSKYDSVFSLQKMPEAKNELSVDDKNFVFTGTLPKNVYFITINTVGLPKDPGTEVVVGPYGIFSSNDSAIKGTPKISYSGTDPVKLFGWNADQSSWQELSGGSANGLNVFVLTK